MSRGDVVLVIEADAQLRQQVKAILEFMGEGAIVAGAPSELNGAFDAPIWVTLFGSGATTSDGAAALAALKQKFPDVPILVMADKAARASLHPDVARDAAGIVDLPLRHAQLASALQDLREMQEQGTVVRLAPRRCPELFRSLVGSSGEVARVRRLIEQVAPSDANVLILGESGTGKEVVARNIHYFSSRRDKAFVPINCGAIPAELLESELFGHEKGAFTGAICARQGRFELADGGTLFLDEIGDMSLHMQVKLLRVLQERVFERVGGNRSIRADVRIIAATHRNLEDLISEGKFREDLFYRLNVFPIEMPPLRERREDVALLMEELVRRYQNEKKVTLKLTHGAVQALSAYHWPGNVRELSNLIERLAILFPNGVVDVQDLPEKFRGHLPELMNVAEPVPPAPIAGVTQLPVHPLSLPRLPREGLDLREHLNNLELSLIKQALEEAGGVVAHAAERLRLRRTTLVEKLRKYGLHRSDEQVSNF
jgi:sigma-54 dependent transcriptional regulator, flagellar regulatory protein